MSAFPDTRGISVEASANSSSSTVPPLDVLMQENKGPLVFSGDEVCIPRSADLLESLGLPGGLLPLKDIQECGFDKETGLVWIKQKKKTQHYFKRAGRMVCFDEEVRAYVEERRLKNVSGVKAKEYMLWAPVGDIAVEGEPGNNEIIRFKSYGGLSRTFPANAFCRSD